MTLQSRDRLLSGPIRSAVFWLALPVLGEQALNACVAWNDTLVAGRISAEATGAVGLASYISWLMSMIAWMVDTGATAVVARAIGAGNVTEARKATHQALILTLGLALLGMTGVMFAAPHIAAVMRLDPQGQVIATHFMRIDALGYLGGAVSFSLASCLRGAGDTRTPMVVLGGVNIINILATWTLTFGVGPLHEMGTDGIAWGTTIARWSGGVWIAWIMFRRTKSYPPDSACRQHAVEMLKLSFSQLRLDLLMIRRILAIGLPAAADGVLTFTGHFIFTTIVTRVPSAFSSTVLYAAHVVGIRIESLSYLPANAWSVAAATLVGQNLGAGQPDRARQSANESVKQAALMLTATGFLYFFAASPLFSLLSNDPRVAECGIPALRGLACVQIPLAVLIVYLGSLRGAGDSRVPMLITLLCMGLIRIPVAWLGGFVLMGGLLGAWMGMFADIVVRAGLLAWRFHGGRWARLRV